MVLSALFAHQGGWDEILFVLAPLVVFAGLLVAARRRVDRLDEGDDASQGESRTSSSDPT